MFFIYKTLRSFFMQRKVQVPRRKSLDISPQAMLLFLSSISFYFKVSSYRVFSACSQTEVFTPQCLCFGLNISSVWDFLPLIRLEHLKLFHFQTEMYSDKLGLILLETESSPSFFRTSFRVTSLTFLCQYIVLWIS